MEYEGVCHQMMVTDKFGYIEGGFYSAKSDLMYMGEIKRS